MKSLGWKVVRRVPGGALGSAVNVPGWARSYAIGQRTTGRKGTPVLAFRTRWAARQFRPSGNKAEFPVFKARLENPRVQSRIASPWAGEHYRGFWEGELEYAADAPEGTLACDAVILLEPA